MQHIQLILLLFVGWTYSSSAVAQTRFTATNGLFVGVAEAPGNAQINALVGYRLGAHIDVGLRAEAGSATYVGPHLGLTAFFPTSDWGVHGNGIYRFHVEGPWRSVIGSGAEFEGTLLRRVERGSTTFMSSAGGYVTTADRFESAAAGLHVGFGAAFHLGTAARVLVVEPVYRYSLYGQRGQWGLQLFFNP